MKKLLFLFSLFSVFAYCPSAWAVAVTEPNTYRVTLKKIEVSQDGGSTYNTLAHGNRTFTINSTDSSGTIVGDFVSGGTLPSGAYNAIRITLSSAFTLTGRILQTAGGSAGTTFCTGGTTGAGCTPAATTVTLTNALVTAGSLSIPSGMTINDGTSEIIIVNTSQPFHMGDSLDNRFKLSFDISQALVIQSDNTLHGNVPSATLGRK